jgi:hypothetical protein
MAMKDLPPPEYQISITRTVANPKYKPPSQFDNYGERPSPYAEQTVTTATLTHEQWQYVQRAMIAVMGNAGSRASAPSLDCAQNVEAWSGAEGSPSA